MKHLHSGIWLFVLTLLLTTLPCSGQEKEMVSLHFVSFPKATNPEPVELLIEGSETIQVELPTNHISKTYEVPALSNWVLGKSSENDQKEFTFETYGKTEALGSKKQLILVIRSNRENDEDLKLVSLDYRSSRFGGGQYFFMNAADIDVGGFIGGLKFVIKPGTHTLLTPEPNKTKNDRNYCFVKFSYLKGKKFEPFFSSTWRLNELARIMVFFYQDPSTHQLRLHIIRSFLTTG